MANKISNETIEQIKVLFNKGISILDISNKLILGKSTVERYIKKLGLTRDRKKSQFDNATLEEVKRLYVEEKLGSPTIAKKLNIDERTIVRQLKNMGVQIRGNKSIDINEIINLYVNEHMPIHVISKKLGSSESRISKLLKENGIEIYGHGMPRFNSHIFDSIGTEEKAYWLGFIFADGYVASINPVKVNYAFELSLKSSDFEHLNTFNNFMGFHGNNVKISKNNIYLTSELTEGTIVSERCRWCISNKHLWETLNSYGCTPRKSLTLQFPDKSIFKDESLIRHFIRGYFDGDGCISFQNKEHTIPTASVYGKSKEFIEKFITYVPYTNSLILSKTNMYGFILHDEKAMEFLHYIYDNCKIYLKRKYDRFKYFQNLKQ